MKIQISKKDDTSSLPERILTITSPDTEQVLRALAPIMELVRNDPDGPKWRKLLSYSNYPTAHTPANSSILNSSMGSGVMGGMGTSMFNAHHSMSNLQSAVLAAGSAASGGDYSSPSSAGFLSMFQNPSAAAAYAAFGNSSLAAQAQAAHHHHHHHQQQQQQAQAQAQAAQGASFNAAMLSYSYAQSLMTNSSYLGHVNPVMVDGVNLMVPGATLCTYEIAVPEIMISSVIGHGGKLLSDLMQATATRITLSGKGEYIPGTYNRKLTIIGPILSVQAAQMIVVQKIIKEQEVYRKQGLV